MGRAHVHKNPSHLLLVDSAVLCAGWQKRGGEWTVEKCKAPDVACSRLSLLFSIFYCFMTFSCHSFPISHSWRGDGEMTDKGPRNPSAHKLKVPATSEHRSRCDVVAQPSNHIIGTTSIPIPSGPRSH